MAASEVRALGNPFHRALNRLLDEHGFDEFAEAACREFYAEKRGRPGIPPGVYFRMPMVGYLEGIGSERGIAWRCADSISLREFLGYGLSKNPPEHSGLSKTRKRLSVEAHAAVFGRVVELLRSSGLPSGRTLGVDSTTLEANAAMRSIVRRDDGKGYEEWLEQVARASGIETPTREDLAKLDRTRPKKKTSNKDWVHPHDPEARIAKMKDGRTRMAHNRPRGDVNRGRVEGWRADRRVRWLFRRFRSGPQTGSRSHVSSPRSSNRMCGSPASGSQPGSCLRPRKVSCRQRKAREAAFLPQPSVGKSHVSS